MSVHQKQHDQGQGEKGRRFISPYPHDPAELISGQTSHDGYGGQEPEPASVDHPDGDRYQDSSAQKTVDEHPGSFLPEKVGGQASNGHISRFDWLKPLLLGFQAGDVWIAN
jgi:hypothetical protein